MQYIKITLLTAAFLALLSACSDQGGEDVADPDATVQESVQAIEQAAQDMVEAVPEPENTMCDRECLVEIADTYIAAMVAHDPAAAPLAEDIRFVENIKAMSPGEGLWESIVTGPDTFSIHVPDEVTQSVGYLGMMRYMATPPAPPGTSAEERAEHAATAEKLEQPVLVALRLQLADGRITEAEHLLAAIRETQADNPGAPFAGRPAPIERLLTPRPGLLTEIPEDQRMEHDILIAVGESYYDALDDNDGSLMPFAEDCQRHENGMVTAGPESGPGPNSNPDTPPIARDCAGQLDSKVFTYIDRIENRRVFAADPVTGLVIGLSHFRHPMDNMPYEVINADGSTRQYEMGFAPFDLPAAHIYKVGADGMVHEIEAMGFMAPYNSPTGWEAWD